MQYLLISLFFLYTAQTHPAEPNIVPLSTLIAPLKQIRINQNGIMIPGIACLIHRAKPNDDYITIDYTQAPSSTLTLMNEPPQKIMIHDPKKAALMPIFRDCGSGTEIRTNLFTNDPEPGTLNYQLAVWSAQYNAVIIMNHLTTESDGSTHSQGKITSTKSFDMRSPLADNHTFNKIKTLYMQVHALVGKQALSELCNNLSHLTHLYIVETALEDTEFAVSHKKLKLCTIKKCGITGIIDSISLPQLDHLVLHENKITHFNIHTLGKQSCFINLEKNNITSISTDEAEPEMPTSYINLRGNPLKKEAVYTILCKKGSPRRISEDLNRERPAIVLDHDDFVVYENGEVEERVN